MLHDKIISHLDYRDCLLTGFAASALNPYVSLDAKTVLNVQ